MTDTSPSLSPLLTVNNLSWQIGGQQILRDINFNLVKGSFTGVIGANGAGKSSLLRCLYRYNKPSAGSIRFNEQDIWQLSANDYAKLTAVVLQDSPSQFNLSVFDVVSLGLLPHQKSFTESLLSLSVFEDRSKSDQQKVHLAIEQVGLSHKLEDNFEHLSGGEKQRILIARAIVQAPQLLIMDEPTSHLDVKYQIEVMALAKSLGITVLASFHDLNLASAMCDNLLALKDGQLVVNGAPSKVICAEMLADVFGVSAEVYQSSPNDAPRIRYNYQVSQQSTCDAQPAQSNQQGQSDE